MTDDQRSMYFSPDGEPIEMLELETLLRKRREDMAQESWWRKRTQVTDDIEVSSVWLGVDHNWNPDGPPHIWETMIFGGDYSEYCWRYPSRQVCLDDHERIVQSLRANGDPGEVAQGA